MKYFILIFSLLFLVTLPVNAQDRDLRIPIGVLNANRAYLIDYTPLNIPDVHTTAIHRNYLIRIKAIDHNNNRVVLSILFDYSVDHDWVYILDFKVFDDGKITRNYKLTDVKDLRNIPVDALPDSDTYRNAIKVIKDRGD